MARWFNANGKSGLEIPPVVAQLGIDCARGGMADAPDLGSGPEMGGGSNPLARTSGFFNCSFFGYWAVFNCYSVASC